MVNSKTKVKNRQLLRSRITQQILLSISKITPGSGRVDGSPDCAEKHKGSSSTAITTSRQNTLLAHLAIVDQLISSYPVSCTCVCFQPYPLAGPRPHLLRMRNGANTFARFVLSSQRVRQIKNRVRDRLVADSHRLASCTIVSGFRAALDLDTYPLRNLIRPRCAELAKPGRGKPVLIIILAF